MSTFKFVLALGATAILLAPTLRRLGYLPPEGESRSARDDAPPREPLVQPPVGANSSGFTRDTSINGPTISTNGSGSPGGHRH